MLKSSSSTTANKFCGRLTDTDVDVSDITFFSAAGHDIK